MPNVENINKLIEAIKGSDTYDQRVYFSYQSLRYKDCKTPGCIAGHALLLFGDTGADDPNNTLRDRLDINDEQLIALIKARPYPYGTGNATKEEAISALEHLRDHDHVKWPERGGE